MPERKQDFKLISRPLGDTIVRSYDIAGENGDYDCLTVAKTPGRLRKFFRRLGLDRSTWTYKVVEQIVNKHGEKVD